MPDADYIAQRANDYCRDGDALPFRAFPFMGQVILYRCNNGSVGVRVAEIAIRNGHYTIGTESERLLAGEPNAVKEIFEYATWNQNA